MLSLKLSDGTLLGYGTRVGGAWATPVLLASDEFLVQHVRCNDCAATFGSMLLSTLASS